jgi:uncharacterized protein (DUF302 family)
MSSFRSLLIPLLMISANPVLAAESSTVVRHTVQAKFADTVDDIKIAITGRGLVIDHTAHVAKMLDRTGKDLGKPKKIYGEDQGQVFSFCSAVVSRGTMEADPHNIVFCPYTIAVYTTLAEPGKVHVAYNRPQRADSSQASRAALREVEKLLGGIVREALNLK